MKLRLCKVSIFRDEECVDCEHATIHREIKASPEIGCHMPCNIAKRIAKDTSACEIINEVADGEGVDGVAEE